MKRPVTLIIAAVLILVMIVLSSIVPLVGGQRMFAASGARPTGNFAQGNFQPRGTPNGTQPDQNNPGTGNPNTQYSTRSGFQGNPNGILQLSRDLQYVLYAVEFILGALAIVGLWLSKKWGKILAFIASGVVIVATLLGMFRMFSTVTLIENVLKILLAIGIIVLVALPKPKPAQVPAQ